MKTFQCSFVGGIETDRPELTPPRIRVMSTP